MAFLVDQDEGPEARSEADGRHRQRLQRRDHAVGEGAEQERQSHTQRSEAPRQGARNGVSEFGGSATHDHGAGCGRVPPGPHHVVGGPGAGSGRRDGQQHGRLLCGQGSYDAYGHDIRQVLQPAGVGVSSGSGRSGGGQLPQRSHSHPVRLRGP